MKDENRMKAPPSAEVKRALRDLEGICREILQGMKARGEKLSASAEALFKAEHT